MSKIEDNGHVNLADEELTGEDKRRIAKQLRQPKEQAPSTRQQSLNTVKWEEQMNTLGHPFDSTRIPISKLYQMRRDPMIAFALQFVKVPLVRAPWYIKCEDAQVAAFVDYALRQIYARLILQHCLALDFGYQAVVKRFYLGSPDAKYLDNEDLDNPEKPVWDEGNVKAVLWKPFVALHPEDVEPMWNTAGEFDGIRYDIEKDVPQGFPGRQIQDNSYKVNILHALWTTNEKDSVFGSIYGYPRIGYAYRYWWSYWYNWALADRHFEKDADPPIIVRYPEDRGVDGDGNEVDYREIALAVGEDARSGSTVAMPSTVIANELDGRPTGVYEWDIKPIESTNNFTALGDRFEYLDIQKIRSIMVPEQAFFEGRGGTSSRNVAAEMGDAFEESQAVLMAEIDDHINRFMIPQLVAANFPERAVSCEKITRGFATDDMALAKQLIQIIGTSDATKLPVDIREVLEASGVPTLTEAELKAQRDREMEEAEEALKNTAPIPGVTGMPTANNADVAAKPTSIQSPGSNANVTPTGFYVNERPKITLAWDDMLPQTKHYKDQRIREMTRRMRAIWSTYFAREYEEFAEFVAQHNIELAEGDDADKQAQEVVDRFRRSKSEEVFMETLDLLQELMHRAGQRELEESRLTQDGWDPELDVVADWVRENGAKMILSVTETTREEMRELLADQIRKGNSQRVIAESIREHFEDFPDWKADRVARTEVKKAYNAATLFAGKSAGILQVQAQDASGGTDETTDEVCKQRNGRIFTIDGALKEDDHPNGTLQWTLLKRSDLSIHYVDEEELDCWAMFEDETGTIFVRKDAPEDAQERYFLALGQAFS